MALMKRLQLGIVGDEGTEGIAERLGALCSRRGAGILIMDDSVGRAALAGSLTTTRPERAVCFAVKEGFSDAMLVRCASEIEAMAKLVDSSDGVLVIAGDLEGDNSKIASIIAGKARRPWVKVVRAEEASDAVGSLMEKIIFH